MGFLYLKLVVTKWIFSFDQLTFYYKYSFYTNYTMVSYNTKPQQHSLSTIQVTKEPVKEVSNLLTDSSISWNDLRGLSWTLFEEGEVRR